NNMLAQVVENLKKKTGDSYLTFLSYLMWMIVLICLACFMSPESVWKPVQTYQLPELKTDKMDKAPGKICSEHDKALEVYCRTDQSFICYLCMMDKHKDHETVSVISERTEKQVELKEEQMKSQQRIEEKQKTVRELKQAVNTIKLSAQTAVEDSERIFNELISSMEKKRSEVTELIRAQEKAELSRAERILQQLDQEIADLQRRLTELEQLSHTHDNIYFLQSLQSLSVSSGHEDSPSIIVGQHLSFDAVRKSLSDLKNRLEEFCQKEFIKIPRHAAAVQVILPPETKSREDFLH
ncbi:tripartite motif-containing protein 16-like, partial [Clarias magur]